MQRAIDRLKGAGKRKARPNDRPLLSDIPVSISENELEQSLGPRSVRKLKAAGHTVTGIRVDTVVFVSPSLIIVLQQPQ